jgi:hypothetical protein
MGADVARIAFAQREYRTTAAIEDPVILARHPLATEMEYNTLFSNEADAVTFGTAVLGLRKLDRWTWSCFVNKENYPNLEIGQTIRVMYPRFGFDAGANFIIKRIKTDANSQLDELNLFGPKGAETDPYWYNVVLLVGAESGSVVDESRLANTFTGAVTSSNASSKIESRSVSFTGGAGMQFADGNQWEFGNGDFTVEAWVNFAQNTSTQYLFSHGVTSPQRGWNLSWLNTGNLNLWASSGGTTIDTDFQGSFTPVVGTYYHIVAERSGSTWRIYVDGVMKAKFTQTSGIFDSNETFRIGQTSGGTSFFTGNMDEIRITKGIARYASDAGYSVPEDTLPRVGPKDPYWQNVSLLVGNTADESPLALTMTNALMSTTSSGAISGSSLYRTASSGCVLYSTDHAGLDFGTGPFTIELFVKRSTVTAPTSGQYQYLLAKWWPAGPSREWAFVWDGDNGKLGFWNTPNGVSGGTNVYSTAPLTLTANTVHHLAVDYDGTTVRLYKDGVMIGSAAVALNIYNGGAGVGLLARHDGAGDWPVGSTNLGDEFRITKGVARYATNASFTVPDYYAGFPRA